MKNYKNEHELIDDLSKNKDETSLNVVRSYRNMKIASFIILIISLGMFSTLIYLEMNNIVITEKFTLIMYTLMCIFMIVGNIVSNRVLGKKFFKYIEENDIIVDNLL